MMQTRCPRCQTLFRVTPEQLKARQGKVRCGHCQAVFDALAALEEEQPTVPVVPLAAPPAALEPAQAPADPEPEEKPPVAAEPEPAEVETLVVAPEPAAPETEPPAAEDLGLEPLLHEEEVPRRRWPWVLGVLTALLLLAFQAVILLRVELAVLSPGLKPALQALCDVAGCDLPLPQKIDKIDIDTSDLHPDTSAEGRLQLVANLRNRAPFAQTWPHLEVTLTDVSDQALVRRVFAPAEYLPADAKPGFPAKGEQPVSLLLEAPGVAAVGYRLYVFYP